MARWTYSAPVHFRGLDGGGGLAGTTSKVAASDTDDKASPRPLAAALALILVVLGTAASVGLLGTTGGPTFKPAAGIGAFALFYVVAQAVERLTELLIAVVPDEWTLNKPAVVQELDGAAAAASAGGEDDAKAAANKKAKLDQVVADRTIVAFGLTGALGAILCSWCEADFLKTIGVTFDSSAWSEPVSALVTVLVIGGGSKQLHDLITRISKANAASTAAGQ